MQRTIALALTPFCLLAAGREGLGRVLWGNLHAFAPATLRELQPEAITLLRKVL